MCTLCILHASACRLPPICKHVHVSVPVCVCVLHAKNVHLNTFYLNTSARMLSYALCTQKTLRERSASFALSAAR